MNAQSCELSKTTNQNIHRDPKEEPEGALLRIHHGDCREVLRSIPDGSVHCCVTSPPYWGLRDYGLPPTVWGGEKDCVHDWSELVQPAPNGIRHSAGMTGPTLSGAAATPKPKLSSFCQQCGAWSGQLGLEPTPELYVTHLVEVFREVRRVLRDDGVLWLNLGDSFYGSWGNYASPTNPAAKAMEEGRRSRYGTFRPPMAGRSESLKPKDLCGIPWRVALALQADGYYLRCDVIWSKPNSIPESVRDRPTRSHEYLFMLTKSKRYYYDGDSVKEACQSGPSDIRKMLAGLERIGGKHKNLHDPLSKASGDSQIGRRRAVGNPSGRNRRSVWSVATASYKGAHFATFPRELVFPCIQSSCPPEGVVLDPFAGSGTTGQVALELSRRAILVELNPEYVALAEGRCRTAKPKSRAESPEQNGVEVL
jgi:DNA modification methylase